MKEYNNEPIIVSLTSHGLRLNHVSKTIFSILSGSFKNLHLVLILEEKDFSKIPEDLKLLIDNDLIELILCKDNLGPHTKYFYTMKKYKDVPIITIDDDGIYEKDTVKILYKTYMKYPNCVCANRVHKITFFNNKINKYKNWLYENTKDKIPSKLLFATGVGGVLYPPDILKISNENLKEIKSCLWADDIYLKVLEIRYNIKVVYTNTNFLTPISFNNDIKKMTQDKGLYIKNILYRNDNYIKHFKEFLTIYG